MSRVARQILLATLGPIALFVAFFWLSSGWYSVDLSGIPDEGQVPAQLLPWFLHSYRLGGSVWSDPMRFATWATACLAYLLPAALAAALSARRPAAIAGAAVVAGLVAWACFSIPPPPAPSEYVGYFTVDTVRLARRWIVGSALAGAIVGILVRALLSRRLPAKQRRSLLGGPKSHG